VAVDGHVLAREEDLVLAVQSEARLQLHVEAVLVTAWGQCYDHDFRPFRRNKFLNFDTIHK
jgi:hypothetical protein